MPDQSPAASVPRSTPLPPRNSDGRPLQEVMTVEVGSAVGALAVARGSPELIVVGSEDATLSWWDVARSEPARHSLDGEGGSIWGLAVGQLDGRRIAVSGGEDGTLRVWELGGDRQVRARLAGHQALVNQVALAQFDGGVTAFSASDDRTVGVWDLAEGRQSRVLTGHSDWVNAVATTTTPDGTRIVVSGSTDRTVRVWNAHTGEAIRTLTGHEDGVSSVAVRHLQDNRVIAASGSVDGTVRVWDPLDGRLLYTVRGHSGRVRTVAIDEDDDGPILVTGGNDHVVRVWRLGEQAAHCIARARHDEPVRAVITGTLYGRPVVVSGSDDRTVKVWALPLAHTDQVAWLSDSPARTDQLRRAPLAQALAERLRRICREEPGSSFLIHLDGPWGTGKSTLVNLLRKELDDDWVAVDFNAWRQSRVGPPWWALLAALRHSIRARLSWTARTRLRILETVLRMRQAGAPTLVAAVAVPVVAALVYFLLGPSGFTLKAASDQAATLIAIGAACGTLWAGTVLAGRLLLWDSPKRARLFEQSNTNPMQSVADHFRWLVQRAGGPVIFLLDDLDRCPQPYVVELLDAVQTLVRLSTERSTEVPDPATAAHFVVAADGVWLRRSYEIAFEQFAEAVAEPGRPLGYLFLDKFFQLRVPVPLIDDARRAGYLRQLLRVRDRTGAVAELAAELANVRDTLRDSTSEEEIVEALQGASPEVRSQVAGEAVQQLTTPQMRAATEHRLQKFIPLLQSNPRSMKRFINAYSVLLAVRILEGNPVPSDSLALWTILETQWPGLADYLRLLPESIELVGRPEAELEDVPPQLKVLFRSPVVRQLVEFRHGGPLTATMIQDCCGAPLVPVGRNLPQR